MSYYRLTEKYMELKPGKTYTLAQMKTTKSGPSPVELKAGRENETFSAKFIELERPDMNPGLVLAVFELDERNENTGEPTTKLPISVFVEGYYIQDPAIVGGRRRAKKTRKGKRSTKKTLRRRR